MFTLLIMIAQRLFTLSNLETRLIWLKSGKRLEFFKYPKKECIYYIYSLLFRLTEISKGIVDTVLPGNILISEMKIDDVNSLKKKSICLVQISDDMYRTMIRTMKKLRNG